MEEYRCLNKFRNAKPKKNKLMSLLNLILACFLIFVINLILCKTNKSYKSFIEKNVFTNNFSFSKLEKTINKYLGDAVPTKKEDTKLVFNEKMSYLNLEEIENGVKLTLNKNEVINSFESGIVVFNGEKDNLGKVLVIEQIDGIEAWYIGINTDNINIYDYIEKSSIIGSLNDNTLTMYFKDNNNPVDYKKYIN